MEAKEFIERKLENYPEAEGSLSKIDGEIAFQWGDEFCQSLSKTIHAKSVSDEKAFFPILRETITEDLFNEQDLYWMTPDGDLRLCIAWGECVDKIETYMYWYVKTSINQWLSQTTEQSSEQEEKAKWQSEEVILLHWIIDKGWNFRDNKKEIGEYMKNTKYHEQPNPFAPVKKEKEEKKTTPTNDAGSPDNYTMA